MKLEVYDGKTKVRDVELKSLFAARSDQALYQAIVGRMSHDRSGNAFTKTKSEVRGGGKKPWRQKGLGRARAGSIRSPLWRGGGVTFGPKPRDFSKAVNKKQRDLAYVTVFGKLAEMGRVRVFSDVTMAGHKTRDFLKLFRGYMEKDDRRVAIIVPEYDKNMVLASRNIPGVRLISAVNLDLVPLVFADRVLISEKAALALDSKFSEIAQ